MLETATRALKNRDASKDQDFGFTFGKGARPLATMGNGSVYLSEGDGFSGSDLETWLGTKILEATIEVP